MLQHYGPAAIPHALGMASLNPGGQLGNPMAQPGGQVMHLQNNEQNAPNPSAQQSLSSHALQGQQANRAPQVPYPHCYLIIIVN